MKIRGIFRMPMSPETTKMISLSGDVHCPCGGLMITVDHGGMLLSADVRCGKCQRTIVEIVNG